MSVSSFSARRGAAALLALSLAASAGAQANTSAIVGRVEDPTRAPLPGARVTARHLDTGLVRTAETGADGAYVLAGVPLGSFEIKVELAGFRPAVKKDVRVVIGEPAVVNIGLELAQTSEEITVSGEAPLVQTRSGELSYLVGAETVRDLPLNGRNYTDLAFLQPGVIAYPHRDGGSVVAHGLAMSVNGQDPRSNIYLLDGTPLNDFTNAPASSAAGTTLGSETVREFRVAANAYSAEFGRNSGGQVQVITKSGSNDFHGSAYEFHRNDALDSANFFDAGRKPDFRRNQFGATVGGPIRKDRTFFFVGYEALREHLGRTVSSIVPDQNARLGLLPDPRNPGQMLNVGVSPAVKPYLDAFPQPNGAPIGGGLAGFTFPFSQRLDQDYLQLRLDQNLGGSDQFFVRYTFDDAEQFLPTDFPQFPRSFASQNHFVTAEYRRIASANMLHTFRGSFSRTRIGQEVEANLASPLSPFVPGRLVGDIDIGGIPRFGPQTSAGVSIRQKIVGFEYGLTRTQGRHLIKAGALAERYIDDLFNPTFSLGIYTFASLETFLRNQPLRFLGLTPDADLERNWRFTLFGFYVQDEYRAGPRLTLNAGVRYEFATLPKEVKGRDATLIRLTDTSPTLGQIYQNPTLKNISPRASFAWDATGDGRTALRGGYGLYFNTNNHQNLIVTITNPPFTPRPIIANPTFPNPPFERGVSNTIRPVQWDLDNPRVHVWNLNVQRELFRNTALTLGYAGSRGLHLLRNADVNVPTPQQLPDGTPFYPTTAARPNSAFATIEQKTSDGDSWYNALVVELRGQPVSGLRLQSSYTFSRNIDTTQASTFFSDATNGTVSAMPEPFGLSYNKGLADYHAKHNWVFNLTWELPIARGSSGAVKALFGDWQVAAIGQLRSGNPLTAFVQTNRSRSRWSPSIGPGTGLDRPSLAPGRTPADAVLGRADQWFDPAAFVLQPAGTLGNLGRGALIGPDLRTVDLALVKRVSWDRLGPAGRVELRVEAFNVFNRVNLGNPGLVAFAGTTDGERPIPSFGRIRTTVTAARQVQLGVRVVF
jgi:hypothetical protein